jgi:hypothetical protein
MLVDALRTAGYFSCNKIMERVLWHMDKEVKASELQSVFQRVAERSQNLHGLKILLREGVVLPLQDYSSTGSDTVTAAIRELVDDAFTPTRLNEAIIRLAMR